MENQTPSLIDNIFCNNLCDGINSGNIYLTISEHLDNPTYLFNDFFWRLQECVDRHALIKKLTGREIKLKVKPWNMNYLK